MSTWSGRRVRLTAQLAAAAGLTAGSVAIVGGGLPGAPAAGAAVRTALTLVAQSQWVVPAAPNGTGTFALTLRAAGAPTGATVRAVLYPVLHDRSTFEQTVRQGPTGFRQDETTAVPVSSLVADPHAAGAVDLSVTVTTAAATAAGGAAAGGGAGPALDLGCAPPTGPGTGACTGVYPVVIELAGPSGQPLDHFTTFLTYVAGRSTRPLQFAWVVPLSARVPVAAHPSSPEHALGPLPPSTAGALQLLVAQLRASPAVPVTVEASPETVQALGAAGTAGRAAVASLAGMSAAPTLDEVLAQPFVPIDLGALAGREPTEVVAQMEEGAGVLARVHVQTAAPVTWVATGAAGAALATGLTRVGARTLVVPDVDLSAAGAGGSGTFASTFTLDLSRPAARTGRSTGTGHPTSGATGAPGRSTGSTGSTGSSGPTGTGRSTNGATGASGRGAARGPEITAAASTTVLAGELGPSKDPALAASRLLADLAMVHFEAPNTTTTRGLIAVPPTGWVPDATFDRVLLAGLQGNPIVTPVTLATYFSRVASAGTRHLKAATLSARIGPSLARTLSAARIRVSAFDSAVPGAPRVLASLDQLLLAAEDDRLGARAQAAGVATFERVLTGQIHLISFSTEKTVTLTARTGWIPITIVSGAPYAVRGTLSVTSDRFTVPPHSARQTLTLDHPTNPVRVDVLARSSGELPLQAVFTSPRGGLVLATGQIDVRSTATSVVGVILSAVALAVLLTWWGRTWRRGRRRRLRAAGDGAP